LPTASASLWKRRTATSVSSTRFRLAV
jgi:hypothetical protein